MNTDATYSYGKLNTSQLKVDKSYQRDLDMRRVRRIAEHFNPLKVNPAKVSYRDGCYWIFDGQHTTHVLKTRNGGENLFIECKIYKGLTQEDEAELFARQNEYEKRVEKNSELKALYTAGNVEVIELKKAVEDMGFVLDFTKIVGTNKIICCAKILKIFRDARIEDFRRFLEIIKYSWHGTPESLRGEIIGGMWLFYITYKGEFDSDTAIRKFSAVSPSEILRDGKALKQMPGDTKYAYQLVNIYNKRQRSNKLDVLMLKEK